MFRRFPPLALPVIPTGAAQRAAEWRNLVAVLRRLCERPSRDPLYLVEQPPVLWFRMAEAGGRPCNPLVTIEDRQWSIGSPRRCSTCEPAQSNLVRRARFQRFSQGRVMERISVGIDVAKDRPRCRACPAVGRRPLPSNARPAKAWKFGGPIWAGSMRRWSCCEGDRRHIEVTVAAALCAAGLPAGGESTRSQDPRIIRPVDRPASPRPTPWTPRRSPISPKRSRRRPGRCPTNRPARSQSWSEAAAPLRSSRSMTAERNVPEPPWPAGAFPQERRSGCSRRSSGHTPFGPILEAEIDVHRGTAQPGLGARPMDLLKIRALASATSTTARHS